jgi:hypothetical protein
MYQLHVHWYVYMDICINFMYIGMHTCTYVPYCHEYLLEVYTNGKCIDTRYSYHTLTD